MKYKVTVFRWNQAVLLDSCFDTLAEVNKAINEQFKRNPGMVQDFRNNCISHIKRLDQQQQTEIKNGLHIPSCNRIYRNFKFKPYKQVQFIREH